MAVIVHGTNVSGGVVIDGGGVQDCEFAIPGLGFPTYVVFEDGSINGGLTVANLTTCWFGTFRNTINGGVHVTNNSFDDPDANEIQDNTIHGPLVCTGNSPAAQQGDSEGGPNTVSGPESRRVQRTRNLTLNERRAVDRISHQVVDPVHCSPYRRVMPGSRGRAS
jgi:hypothetical protein